MIDWVELATQQVVRSIGQLTAADKRALDAAAHAGRIVKWREHWAGIGPLKTCYGPKGWT